MGKGGGGECEDREEDVWWDGRGDGCQAFGGLLFQVVTPIVIF